MKIKQVLEKALEGGYKPGYALTEWTGALRNLSPTGIFGVEENGNWYGFENMLLDPLFWQSLGKAMKKPKELRGMKFDNRWLFEWHRFIDHLAEGEDAESFFKNL